MSSRERDRRSFEFSNNAEGFKKLWDRICWSKVANHLEEVVVGFESTGAYGEPLVTLSEKETCQVGSG